jgi:hypothetical protein
MDYEISESIDESVQSVSCGKIASEKICFDVFVLIMEIRVVLLCNLSKFLSSQSQSEILSIGMLAKAGRKAKKLRPRSVLWTRTFRMTRISYF